LLGHIFFDTFGAKPTVPAKSAPFDAAETDSMTPELNGDANKVRVWELADYHRFMGHFNEAPLPTIRECKEMIRENLNVNLYDLLNWFRNTDSSTRPKRFATVAELGDYSYERNKVFPLHDATFSRVAKPLLRKIAKFKYQRYYNRAIMYRPASKAATLEGAATSGVAKPAASQSTVTAAVTTETPADIVMAAVVAIPGSDAISGTTTVTTTAATAATATATATTVSSTAHGASLFILPESVEQTLAKPSHFPTRRRRTGLHRREHSENVAQVVEVVA
jgi:hypothetical protein